MDNIKNLKAKQIRKKYTKEELETIRQGALKVILRQEKKEQEKRRADLEHFYETHLYT